MAFSGKKVVTVSKQECFGLERLAFVSLVLFPFCQRSPTIPATANDHNDHDRWDRIRVYLCDRSDRERSSAIAKSKWNHQCSDCSDRNDPSDHMETIAQRTQRS